MTDHQSDAELHMERLVQIAVEPVPLMHELPAYDLKLILVSRLEMARLMMALAVRLAGK